MSDVDVCVIGMGYIGLPTSLVLAKNGSRVHGVDTNTLVVDSIRRAKATFDEPGIDELVSQVVTRGLLSISSSPVAADVYIIAVPTPVDEASQPDISCILSAARSIAEHLCPGDVVILESTSPVGTTERMAQSVHLMRPDLAIGDVHFAHCPERVIPGRMLEEIQNNDRVVGGLRSIDASRAARVYSSFCSGAIHLTDAKTAEMTKLAENSFRDVNIAFANELSILAESLDMDVWEVIELANRHPRVNILKPGPGVGGHCIAVDPWFLVSSSPENTPLIRTARQVNDSKPEFVIAKIERLVAGVADPVVGFLGLAFKANVDDLRESPSVAIVAEFAQRNPELKIVVVEPYVSELPQTLRDCPNVTLCCLRDVLELAEVLVLLVDHDDFQHIPREKISKKLAVDTRGMWRELDV